MKLIKINLNQTVSKAQLDQIIEERNRWFLFGGICFLFISYLLWFGFINYRMNYVIENRQETIAEIIRDTENLKKSGKINLSKIDIKTLNKFESKRMFWAPKLIALSEITPDDMSITRLNFENKKLEISAISKVVEGEKDMKIVQQFMKRIEENEEFNKDFKELKFDSSERTKAKGQQVLSFTIKARLK